jgi:hypothetical protein
VRISSILPLIFLLAACNHGLHSNDGVRQGVLDHLARLPMENRLNLDAMDVKVTSVQIKGNEADATVLITAKGGDPSTGMSINYHLRQEGNGWVVVGRQDSGAAHGALAAPEGSSPHAGGIVPGSPNPHGDGVPASGAGKMPSPEDLPPAGAKK